MASGPKDVATRPLQLAAETAADLMTPNPISLRADATLREAIALLTDKGIGAAPVIDEAGRPVGVLSRADILIHQREQPARREAMPSYYQHSDLGAPAGETLADRGDDAVRVRDLMTPAVFAIPPDAPPAQVVRDMVALKVHRLFVVDRAGVLVGVISALDVLRRLVG